MTSLVVQTPEGVELKLELAGAGSRFAAGLLDLLLIAAGMAVLGLALLALGAALPSSFGGFLAGLYLGGFVLLALAYPAVFGVLQGGTTPGKRALGLRVTAADGSPARPLQHVLRSLLLVVDVLLWAPAPLGLLLIALTPRHTRLGDLAAGTVVLRVARAATLEARSTGPRWSELPEHVLILPPDLAARLAPADVSFLRAVLARTGAGGLLEPRVRDALLRDVATAFARRLGLPEPQSQKDARVLVFELLAFANEHVAEEAA